MSNDDIKNYIEGICNKAIISIDSPLGWPKEMISSLYIHTAGQSIQSTTTRADYFRRSTDRLIIEKFGKTPFSVGADKIAATAFDALSVIGDLSDKFGLDYGYGSLKDGIVIESYPAVHLIALLGSHYGDGYKDSSGNKKKEKRAKIFELLARHYESVVNFSNLDKNTFILNDDVFDSFICLLTAIDYDRGKLIGAEESIQKHIPIDLSKTTLKKEGYIWGLR